MGDYFLLEAAHRVGTIVGKAMTVEMKMISLSFLVASVVGMKMILGAIFGVKEWSISLTFHVFMP